jgi:rhodanese-related sulfurtransferase
MDCKRLWKEISLLLGVAIVLAIIVNYFSPAGIALVGQWDTSQGMITARAKNEVLTDKLEIEEVTIAKQIYDSGDVLFVDARSRDNYDDGHIPGAVSLPVGEFDNLIDAFMDQHSADQAIVTYCSGRTCTDSHNLARLLMDFGFTDVKIFIDGFPGWEAEGHPIE